MRDAQRRTTLTDGGGNRCWTLGAVRNTIAGFQPQENNSGHLPPITDVGTGNGNVVDRAADSADAAIAATQRATNNLLSGVSDKIHTLRERASPAVDKVVAPFDAASAYTQQAPLKSLLIAAAAGAAAMAIVSLLSRSR